MDKSNWSLILRDQKRSEEEKREEEEEEEEKKRREEEMKSKKVWILAFLYGNHEFGMGLCVFGPW